MSSSPIMVHSKKLRENLPELFITDAFGEARAQEQEAIDEQEFIRRAFFTEDMNCIPNPKKVFRNGRSVTIPEVEREIIRGKNGSEFGQIIVFFQ